MSVHVNKWRGRGTEEDNRSSFTLDNQGYKGREE